MRHGGRAPAEFIEGIPRRNMGIPSRLQSTELEATPHIDLRILRRATIDDGKLGTQIPYEDDWDFFLKKLGKKNHHFGAARTLGSVAITMVPSGKMNHVLRESKPKEYFHPRRKIELFRRIGGHITDFIRESAYEASGLEATRVAVEREAALVHARQKYTNGDELTETDYIIIEQHETGLSPGEVEQIGEHAFGRSIFAVNGLAFYGRRYGTVLSANEQLFEERNALITFMRTDLKLDTGGLSRNWDAHGSVFDLFDHAGLPELSYDASTLPAMMAYDQPIVEQHVFPK